jgi:beta-glucosidase
LPYTLAKQRSDYPSEVTYLNDSSTTSPYVQVNYTEGTLTDYRHFDAHQIDPRFEVGFGLSYSHFEYGQPRGKWLAKTSWEELYVPAHRKGLPSALFEDVYEFSFTITNTGAYDAHEVPQAYLSAEGERVKVLRKFERVHLKKGQTKRVTWRLNRYDLSRWDTKVGSWVKREGKLQLLVGQSSRKIRGTLKM